MINEEALKALARQVETFMREGGAVRNEAGKVQTYMTRFDLALSCDFAISDWVAIKEQMLKDGVAVLFTPGLGHFIGAPGEELYNVLYSGNMASGWSNRTKRYWEAIGHENTPEREAFAKSRGIDLEALSQVFRKEG